MIRQFYNIADSDTFRFARFELNAVLVVDADGGNALFVAMQFFIVQGAIFGQSQNILLLLHQVDNLDILVNYLWLKPMLFVIGFALCIEFL